MGAEPPLPLRLDPNHWRLPSIGSELSFYDVQCAQGRRADILYLWSGTEQRFYVVELVAVALPNHQLLTMRRSTGGGTPEPR